MCGRAGDCCAVAGFGRGRLETRRRLPPLTLRCGGDVVTSCVAVDSKQTVRLDQRTTRDVGSIQA